MSPRARSLVLLAAAVALAAGCARKMPPSGGPRDVRAPFLMAGEPDSGAVRVPVDQPLRLLFSEPMDRASVEGAVFAGPGLRFRKVSWEGGRTFVLHPESSLVAGRTYVILLGSGARDVRGNGLVRPAVVHFTTADSFPPGRIEGEVQGRGVTVDGVYVWAYREDLGRAPDSTSLDMDALDQTRQGGRFRLPGLPVPGTYRLYTLADRNRNRTFEPGQDLLTRSDSLVSLTAAAPAAAGVRLLAVDPEALALVSGAVIDSLAPGEEALRVEARGVADARVPADRVPVVVIDAPRGRFQGSLRGGRWRLVAWRDLNDDRALQPNEPRSAPVELDVQPGVPASGIVLVLAALPVEP